MSSPFKNVASAQDLRAVQTAVLWDWAVCAQVPLPEAAKRFATGHRSIWPLRQLGDPRDPQDRMFSVDEAAVLKMLRRMEERYGKYEGGSTTELSTTLFQRTSSRVSSGPVWVRNTRDPRAHVRASLQTGGPLAAVRSLARPIALLSGAHASSQVEALLKKYGVAMLPSSAPSCRLYQFFASRSSLFATPDRADAAAREYHGPVEERSGFSQVSEANRPRTSVSWMSALEPASPASRGAGPRASSPRRYTSPLGLPLPLGSPRTSSTSPGRRSPGKRSGSPREVRSPETVMSADLSARRSLAL